MAWRPVGWSVGRGERHCQKLGQTRESFPPARNTDSSRLLQPDGLARGRNIHALGVSVLGPGPGACTHAHHLCSGDTHATARAHSAAEQRNLPVWRGRLWPSTVLALSPLVPPKETLDPSPVTPVKLKVIPRIRSLGST